MKQKQAPEKLMKISELAKASGVSVSTVKFYVKEGLIRAACKTGRNMAYYDPGCVGTIGIIRMLQKERFYPLSVIKRLLESSPVSELELELLDAIHKVDYQSSGNTVSLSEAVRRTRLSADQIAQLVRSGIVTPVFRGKRQLFTKSALRVMSLVRKRLDAGIPFAQSVCAFQIYERALREAARADVDSLAAGALMVPDFTAEHGAQIIRVSDETLDAFIGIRRKELNREYGSRRLEDLDRFEENLTQALRKLAGALEETGFSGEAAICRAALNGEPTGLPLPDEAVTHYWSFLRDSGGDIAKSIAGSVRSRAYFIGLEPASDAGGALSVRCLKVCWLKLAPPILDCAEAARRAREELDEALQTTPGGAGLRDALDEILTHTGG